MSTPEEIRAYQHQMEQKRIYDKRMAALRRLLAPPGPRLALKVAWDPLTRQDPPLAGVPGPRPGRVDLWVDTTPPPEYIPGSDPGDKYADISTGTIYTLED